MGVPGPPDGRVPALRASDAERDRAVARLRDGASEGRLTFDELAQRVELAYGAVTGGELERLVSDLPAPGAPPATTLAAVKRRRWSVAVMGGSARRGRWYPPRAASRSPSWAAWTSTCATR